ncbi:hypothetical protein [Sinomicrobium sp. M5D2P17]
MKKTLFILVILVQTAVFAQQEMSEGKEFYQEILQEQIHALQLEGDQKKAFTEISNKYYDKTMAIRESNASRMSRFKELKSLRESKDNELKAVLDENEFEAYKELQKENREKLKEANKKRKN